MAPHGVDLGVRTQGVHGLLMLAFGVAGVLQRQAALF